MGLERSESNVVQPRLMKHGQAVSTAQYSISCSGLADRAATETTNKFPLFFFLTVAVVVEPLSNYQEVRDGGDVPRHALPIPKDLGPANKSKGESRGTPSAANQHESDRGAIPSAAASQRERTKNTILSAANEKEERFPQQLSRTKKKAAALRGQFNTSSRNCLADTAVRYEYTYSS